MQKFPQPLDDIDDIHEIQPLDDIDDIHEIQPLDDIQDIAGWEAKGGLCVLTTSVGGSCWQ